MVCKYSLTRSGDVGGNIKMFSFTKYGFPHNHLIFLFMLNNDNETKNRIQQILLTKEQRHDKTNKMSVRPAKTQISLGI